MASKTDETTDAVIGTYKDAARLCGVALGTVYSWVATRHVPHLRLGRRLVRFDMRELRQWLDSHRVRVGTASVDGVEP